MRKTICFALVGGVLAGCGGSGKAFIGATEVTVSPDGSVLGASGQSLSIVETDAGSFGHGFIRGVDATVIGNSFSAASGDTGSFAASGIVDGFDVGTAYISGTASYVGDYAMTVVTDYESSPNPDNWTVAERSGQLIASIELHTATDGASDPDHGHSHDVDVVELFINNDPTFFGDETPDLVFEEVIIYSPTPPARPSNQAHSFNGGYANVNGQRVPLTGEIAFGSTGMIASFDGTARDTLVAGGFGLGIVDDDSLVTE